MAHPAKQEDSYSPFQTGFITPYLYIKDRFFSSHLTRKLIKRAIVKIALMGLISHNLAHKMLGG